MTGMMVSKDCFKFEELQSFISAFLNGEAMRCLSPNRQDICNEAATRIFWQDKAEWYPCCPAHWPGDGQWSGSTRFTAHTVELIVIPEKADAVLNAMAEHERKDIEIDRYDRDKAVGDV